MELISGHGSVAQKFFKKRLAEHPPVRIMRDLGGGSPPAKDLPERPVC
jgi:hypothetical protein